VTEPLATQRVREARARYFAENGAPRAFQRGLASGNLYDREWDDGILDRTVGELRRELGLDASG
jgi:hypothetical protein